MKIAVLDSGIEREYYNKNNFIVDCFKYEMNQNKIQKSINGYDVLGHGTQSIDCIHRLAPTAKFVAIKILDDNGLTSVDVLIKALEDLIETDVNFINLSLSLIDKNCKSLENVCKNLQEQGKIIVASVENGKHESIPACYSPVIGVRGMMFSNQELYAVSMKENIEVICDCSPMIVNRDYNSKSLYSGNSKATCIATSFLHNEMEKSFKQLNKVELLQKLILKHENQKNIYYYPPRNISIVNYSKSRKYVLNMIKKIEDAELMCMNFYSCALEDLYSKRLIELGELNAKFICDVIDCLAKKNNLNLEKTSLCYCDFEWFWCIVNYVNKHNKEDYCEI